MIDKKLYSYLISTDGINQFDRSTALLDPASVKIDERSTQDLLRFLLEVSSQLQFYNSSNQPQGDWRPFLKQVTRAGDILPDKELEALYHDSRDCPPHLALLLAFLKVFKHVQHDLNLTVGKRLEFYYDDVLQINRSQPVPDEVHVLFELAKNRKPELITPGVLLDAGKTSSGAPLQYAVQNNIVVSHTVVRSLMSTYVDKNLIGKRIVFRSNEASSVFNNTHSSWRPFGAKQLSLPPESRPMTAVSFGWSVASPNFLMAEGLRTVNLVFHLRSVVGTTSPGLLLLSMLNISFTSEKEWLPADQLIQAELIPLIPVNAQDATLENPFRLEITFEIQESSPAVTRYVEEVHQKNISTPWPLIQISIDPESYILETLSAFRVERVDIDVNVQGVKDLIVQNDQTLQVVDKPMLPFGTVPMIGSNFYVGSEEIFSKSLKSLQAELEWQDPPADIVDYYEHYGNSNILLEKFQMEMHLLNRKNWNTQLMKAVPVFSLSNPQATNKLTVSPVTFQTQVLHPLRNPYLDVATSYDHTAQQGFIRLKLTGPTQDMVGFQPTEAPFEAFGHKTFQSAYLKQALAMSKFTGVGTPPELPNPPYIPTLKSITLNYSAGDVLLIDNPNGIDQFFIQDVFGATSVDKNEAARLIPDITQANALYIGLENSKAPESISFLFQIEEGSVPGETLLRSEDLKWSYLAGNTWKNMTSMEILEDSTDGFQQSGLVRVNVGGDATYEHNLMPPSLRWLRVNVEDPDGAAGVMDIFTQAARAKLLFQEETNKYEDHLKSPLPASSISKLVTKNPAFKKVSQPFPSFGGRPLEVSDLYYQRVSERLRHKNRAITEWDYERLTLSTFPEIFKVKCLPHADPAEGVKPGNVWLVVVPDWRKHPIGDPLQPKANKLLLRRIEVRIEENFSSSFVNAHVTNPRYETLLVDCKVQFYPDFDPGHYAEVLNEEIKKFLSPWAYEEGRDIVFGGKVHASEILAFIEGRDYVDHVADFELYHRHDGYLWGGISDMEINLDFIVGYSPDPSVADSVSGDGGKTINLDFIVGEPVEIAFATRPDTILVSNNTHRIEALTVAPSCKGTHGIGIGQMIVGLDFVPIS